MKLSSPTDADILTPCDVALIQSSFRSLQRESGPAARRFFRELFSYDSSLRDLFAPDPWTRQDHLFGAMHDIVDQLEPNSIAATRLKAWVQRFPAYAVNSYYHLYFGAALFAMFEDVLGSRFNADVYSAWFKLFQRVVIAVKDAAQDSAVPTPTTQRPFAHATAA